MRNPFVPGKAYDQTEAQTVPHKPPVVELPGPTTQPVVGDQPRTAAPTAPQPATVRVAGSSDYMPALPNFSFAEDRLNNMLATDSTFLREAQRRGLDAAAARGGLNSSIAAGLSTREAIRAAAPIATADAQFTQEDYLTGRRALLDNSLRENDAVRTARRDVLLGDIRSREMNQEADLLGQRDVRLSGLRRQELAFEMDLTQQARDNDVQREAWLTQQNEFTRMYSTAMNDSRRTGLGFLDQLGSAFINDPEVYSPEVVSGMSNFFQGLVDGTTNSSVSRLLQDIVGFNTRPQAPTTPVSPGQLPAPPREPERTQPIPSTPFWDI